MTKKQTAPTQNCNRSSQRRSEILWYAFQDRLLAHTSLEGFHFIAVSQFLALLVIATNLPFVGAGVVPCQALPHHPQNAFSTNPNALQMRHGSDSTSDDLLLNEGF
ncbi:hypothetical protein Y032_0223g2679 [Ancylostoma ceylanicum]|uniref:Uncharacterized protein n=1 Tax=Ancylostoma ceylanicum TaxID=53326 RepID=A0A016SHI9_9BILA|nr:hypothetical protein Y032_0223g2679 [Ancylostoma ceylanicum]